MRRFTIFLFFLPFAFQIAYANELPSAVLPIKPILRPEGVQQIGNTCHATAFLTALEHHFQRIDKPVKLSLFYMIYSMGLIVKKSINKEPVVYDPSFYDEASMEFLEKHGSVLPYYMHPEEHRMTSSFFSEPPQGTKYFLTPKQANVPEEYSVGWPILRAHTLVHDVFEGFPMFLGKDRDPIQVLKEVIVKNQPAALSFTGLPIQRLFSDSSYRKAPYLERFILNTPMEHILRREIPKEELDKFYSEIMALTYNEPLGHLLAVVGFDDSMYQNYGYKTGGGFILKGTWDDSSHEYSSIPYQIILDLVEANAVRWVDSVNTGNKGGGTYLLKLEVLDLPEGFDEEVFNLHEKYKNEDQFTNFYMPYLFSLRQGRSQIDSFNSMLPEEVDIKKLSPEEDDRARKLLVSLITPWSDNFLINVAVVSGMDRLLSLVANETFSFAYKYSPQRTIFPDGNDISFLESKGKDFDFIFNEPNNLVMWQGLFSVAKLMQRHLDEHEAKNDL